MGQANVRLRQRCLRLEFTAGQAADAAECIAAFRDEFLGGILAGAILGFGLQLASTFAGSFLLSGIVPGVLISAGAACVGAYQRLH